MSAAAAPAAEGADGAAAPAPKKSKKMLFIILGAVLLLAGGGGAAAFFLMGGEEDHEAAAAHEAEAHEEEAAGETPTYVDVPEMVVNLRTADGQTRYLKIHFMLVAATPEAAPEITARLPAVKDAVQPFLRELRPEDLAGSAAVFRIKEELVRRARGQLPPDSLKDVLIQTMVQQ